MDNPFSNIKFIRFIESESPFVLSFFGKEKAFEIRQKGQCLMTEYIKKCEKMGIETPFIRFNKNEKRNQRNIKRDNGNQLIGGLGDKTK